MELKDFLLSYFSSDHYEPARMKDLAQRFGLQGQEQLAFYDLMDAMLAAGQVQTSPSGQILLGEPGHGGTSVAESTSPVVSSYGGVSTELEEAEASQAVEGAGEAEGAQEGDGSQTADDKKEAKADKKKAKKKSKNKGKGKKAADSLAQVADQEDADADRPAQKADRQPLEEDYFANDAYFESDEETGNEEERDENLDPLVGRLSCREKGFAFFISDVEGQDDVFIKAEDLGQGLNGDRVRIVIKKEADQADGLNAEGRVVEVLERNPAPIVGSYQQFSDFGFVVSDNRKNAKDLYIDEANSLGAQDGEKVVARVDRFDPGQDNPEGHITEILGSAGDKGVDITAVARAFELPYQFSEETLAEAQQIPQEVSPEEMRGRKDLRSLFTVTIDGEDARDFDDAISVEKKGRFYNLYVHIADVSHYVQPGSAIDRDAYDRGNSVYLLDRVIPMLPEELSNGICSLNPGEDRLAMTTQMTLDGRGEILDYKFYRSVIQSDRRLVYTDVSNYLENGLVFEDNETLLDALDTMRELYLLLAQKRVRRGALDFDIAESKIRLDAEGRAIGVEREERRIANRIIEEFMILNNEMVGGYFADKNLPFLYRIHDDPAAKRVENLNRALYAFGYPPVDEESKPADFQRILDKAKGSAEEPVLNLLVLQSMQKAIYSPQPIGHFGLAADHYSHFTAPIRRYSDLIAHRLVKAFLDGKPRTDQAIKDRLKIQAKHVSDTEQKAIDAERDVVAMKSAEYMQQYVGEYFTGVVSGLTHFGIFVMLDNTVEGLIHFRTLHDDYYTYDEDHFEVRGEQSHRLIHYGDRLKVQVVAANPQQRTIDFAMSEEGQRRGASRDSRRGKNPRPTASHARGSKASNAFRREREEGKKGYKTSKSNRRTAKNRKNSYKKRRG